VGWRLNGRSKQNEKGQQNERTAEIHRNRRMIDEISIKDQVQTPALLPEEEPATAPITIPCQRRQSDSRVRRDGGKKFGLTPKFRFIGFTTDDWS